MTDSQILQALRICSDRSKGCSACQFSYDNLCYDNLCYELLTGAAADLIERLTAENAALQEKWLWKPVFDGGPEREGCYLVTVRHWLDGAPVAREAFWNGVDWLSCERRHEITPRVTHWTPLPKAAEEGEKA